MTIRLKTPREDAIEVVHQLIALGVEFRVDDSGRRILYRPKDRVPLDIQARLAGNRWAIISYLETDSGWVDMALSALRNPAMYEELRMHFDECAAVREYEMGNTRDEAESIALQHFIEVTDRWAESAKSKQPAHGGTGTNTPHGTSETEVLVPVPLTTSENSRTITHED